MPASDGGSWPGAETAAASKLEKFLPKFRGSLSAPILSCVGQGQFRLSVPARFHFLEMLRPLSSGQIQSITRLCDALKMNGGWNSFGLSNLGNVVVSGSDAPFRVEDLRLYVHSFNIRTLGLIPYTLNGEMRFYLVSDEKCLRPDQVDALKREFMLLLEEQVARPADCSGGPPNGSAVPFVRCQPQTIQQ